MRLLAGSIMLLAVAIVVAAFLVRGAIRDNANTPRDVYVHNCRGGSQYGFGGGGC